MRPNDFLRRPHSLRGARLIAVWGLAIYSALAFVGGCSERAAPHETIDIGGDMSDILSFDTAVRDGAALAIAQAGSVRGFRLRFVPYDDTAQGAWNADAGAANMQKMVADPRMLGMLGPLRGPVAQSELPIANKAALAMISPTVTEPCLTHPLGRCSLFTAQSDSQAYALRLRPTGKNNYFHLAATDDLHGPAMAEFAYYRLNLRRIAVVDFASPVGSFASDSFVAAFTRAGGIVVARQSFDLTPGPVAPDFRPWLHRVKAANAEAIYTGGLDFDQVGPVSQSGGILGPGFYYLGIDELPDVSPVHGIAESEDQRGSLDDHFYASRGIGAPYLNAEAAGTIAAFVKLHPTPDENTSVAFAGYDAATILIHAIGRAIDANGGKIPSRQQVVDQLSKTANFHGLTATYTFTADGDPVTSTLQIVQYRDDAWTALTNMTVANQ